MRTVPVEIEIPLEAYHAIESKVAAMSKEEQHALDTAGYSHDRVAQYFLEEYIMTRRNLAEEIVGTTSVEVTDAGEIRPTK